MSKQKELHVLNFHLKFGQYNMLDFLEEIVLPAFLEKGMERIYGDSKYFFDNVQLIQIPFEEVPTLAITGRYIKDTVLKRSQVYRRGIGIVDEPGKMPTAPSSIFVLILNTHKLLYAHETAYAPDNKNFEITVLHFLKKKWEKFIDLKYGERKKTSGMKKVIRENLKIDYPKPTLTIVPLSSEESIDKFIRRYELLRTIKITVVETNQEFDVDNFFHLLRDQREELSGKHTQVEHRNPKGMNKEAAIKQFSGISNSGNHKIEFIGKDYDGDTLRGNNDDFKLRVQLLDLPREISESSVVLYNEYKDLIEKDVVRKPSISENALQKINKIIKKVF